jgi:alkylhydroperoxidase family enzyme
MFIATIDQQDATGEIAQIYRDEAAALGFVMEGTKCWTALPHLSPMVENLLNAARSNFSLGLINWRLITLIAAKEIPSTYCSHVYAKLLVKDLGSKVQVLAIQRDFRKAGLTSRQVAMLTYAEQVVRDASLINEDDITVLRTHHFSDREIADIAFCASYRCFMSRYFDAVGAMPEDTWLDADDEFRTAMTVGKAV